MTGRGAESVLLAFTPVAAAAGMAAAKSDANNPATASAAGSAPNGNGAIGSSEAPCTLLKFVAWPSWA
jgi:hypothetical protein